MVQATDFANREDPATFGRLKWPAVRCILAERKVGARLVIVREVAGEGAAQMPFAKDENMIQALARETADEPFHERILPKGFGAS